MQRSSTLILILSSKYFILSNIGHTFSDVGVIAIFIYFAVFKMLE